MQFGNQLNRELNVLVSANEIQIIDSYYNKQISKGVKMLALHVSLILFSSNELTNFHTP